MKRLIQFKGYVTETGYDETTGRFVALSSEHPFAPPASAAVKPLKRKRRNVVMNEVKPVEDAA